MEAGRVSKTDAEYQNIFPLSSRYSNILNIMEYQERALNVFNHRFGLDFRAAVIIGLSYK